MSILVSLSRSGKVRYDGFTPGRKKQQEWKMPWCKSVSKGKYLDMDGVSPVVHLSVPIFTSKATSWHANTSCGNIPQLIEYTICLIALAKHSLALKRIWPCHLVITVFSQRPLLAVLQACIVLRILSSKAGSLS